MSERDTEVGYFTQISRVINELGRLKLEDGKDNSATNSALVDPVLAKLSDSQKLVLGYMMDMAAKAIDGVKAGLDLEDIRDGTNIKLPERTAIEYLEGVKAHLENGWVKQGTEFFLFGRRPDDTISSLATDITSRTCPLHFERALRIEGSDRDIFLTGDTAQGVINERFHSGEFFPVEDTGMVMQKEGLENLQTKLGIRIKALEQSPGR